MNRKFLTRSRNDRASLGQGVKNRKCPQGDFMKNDIEEAKDVQSLTRNAMQRAGRCPLYSQSRRSRS